MSGIIYGLYEQIINGIINENKVDQELVIKTGQRYINQLTNGGNVLFFVREYKKEATFASPFTCLGFADFQSHYGSAPISIVWKMRAWSNSRRNTVTIEKSV